MHGGGGVVVLLLMMVTPSGPVPILVGVDGQLNAMATVDHDIKGSVSMGAEMEAAGRFGVDWQKGAGWQKISDASWNATYWEPEWDFGLDDDGATASAAPTIPPQTAYASMCTRARACVRARVCARVCVCVCVSRRRTLSDPGR